LSSKSTFSNKTSKSYAQALYELAQEKSDIKNIENQMIGLNKLIDESSDFKEMILNPSIPKENKKKVIYAIADKNNFSKILKNFLGFLTFKNRLFYLKQIINSFLNFVSVNKGELKAKLYSSKPLSKDELESIQNELSKDFNSTIKIDYKHDPNLIAGLIIQVGSIMVDTSVRSQLKRLEKDMLGA